MRLIHAFCNAVYHVLRRSTFNRPIYSPLVVIGGFKWLLRLQFDPAKPVCLLTAFLVSKKPNPWHALAVECRASLRCGTAPKQETTRNGQYITDNKRFVMMRFRSNAISASALPRFSVHIDVVSFSHSYKHVPTRSYEVQKHDMFQKHDMYLRGQLFKLTDDLKAELCAESPMRSASGELELTWNNRVSRATRGCLLGRSPMFSLLGRSWSLLLRRKGVQLCTTSNMDSFCIMCQLFVVGKDARTDIYVLYMDKGSLLGRKRVRFTRSRTMPVKWLCDMLRDKGEVTLGVKLTLHLQ